MACKRSGVRFADAQALYFAAPPGTGWCLPSCLHGLQFKIADRTLRSLLSLRRPATAPAVAQFWNRLRPRLTNRNPGRLEPETNCLSGRQVEPPAG